MSARWFSLALALVVASTFAVAPAEAQQPERVRRPRDPWAFRTVLDGEPHRLVLALDTDLWVAYDLSSGAKLQTWAGGRGPDGASAPVHETLGHVYAAGETRRWELRLGPRHTELEAYVAAITVDDDALTLEHVVEIPGQRDVRIDETLRLASEAEIIPVGNRFVQVPADGRRVVLQRSFRCHSVPGQGDLLLVLLDHGTPETLAAIGSLGGLWTLSQPEDGSQPFGVTIRFVEGAEVSWSNVHRVPADAVAPARVAASHDGQPSWGQPPAPPGYTLQEVDVPGVPAAIASMTWLPGGLLGLTTSDATGAVWIVDGLLDPPEERVVVATRLAAGLDAPCGLAVVDERLFVLQRDELTELVDADGDGRAETARRAVSGWGVRGLPYELAVGLAPRDGLLYCALSRRAGGPVKPAERGAVLALDPLAGSWQVVTAGVSSPAGLLPSADGGLFVVDGPGAVEHCSRLGLIPAEALASPGKDTARLSRVAWLRTEPRRELPSRPSAPVAGPPGHDGAPSVFVLLDGELLRVGASPVDGQLQGWVVRVARALTGPGAQLSAGPDGALWLGAGADDHEQDHGHGHLMLRRLEATGASRLELTSAQAAAEGLLVELSEPLPPDVDRSWRIEQSFADDWRSEPLQVAGVSLAPDRRSAVLEVPGLTEGRVVDVGLVVMQATDAGRVPVASHVWLSLERFPAGRAQAVARELGPSPNALTPDDEAAGWQLLFDGVSTAGWRGFRQAAMPDGWVVEDGCLVRVGPGGDIITEGSYRDFELSFEWAIDPGGNSGVFFHVSEDGEAVWSTGPEMQVLDNAGHPDGRAPRTSAGANYALHAPARDVTRPPGEFNAARIVVLDGHVEHWLNGVLLLEYDLGSPAWEALVAASKFADLPRYGREAQGHIALQDHGDRVRYRHLRIRPLPVGG